MKGFYRVGSVEETYALAQEFASTLKKGDIVCLEGDLGAGKTTFTQALAASMDLPGAVTSPTFCIVQEHRTQSLTLVHMDLYRLNNEDDVLAIGWEDYIDEGAILVVEWPERAGSLIPDNAKKIVFRHTSNEEERIIEFL
jgi:tRNA threonylcarbamoyladenosine biosynthesis protein TsaE